MTKHLDPTLRHDFLILFDVADGNPNGDPDSNNRPRQDDVTSQGIVTDVSIKRKIRDYIAMHYGDEGYAIYVSNGTPLNAHHDAAHAALGFEDGATKRSAAKKAKGDVETSPSDEASKINGKRDNVSLARDYMISRFFDVRMFGAVMSTGRNCGQVKGPMQLSYARSIDPIDPITDTITRVCPTAIDKDSENEMGNKSRIPYGLYRGMGSYNPMLAQGVSETDLQRAWQALEYQWQSHRTASSGQQHFQGLVIFTHEDPLGNAHVHKLYERVQVRLKDGCETPRSIHDYDVVIDREGLPEGVTITVKMP